jgi:methionyl-tRNA synthetase
LSAHTERVTKFGYHCEECEEAVFPATTRAELAWLRDRRHLVKEVSKHMSGGLDQWMDEGLDFLERHNGHSVVLVRSGP